MHTRWLDERLASLLASHAQETSGGDLEIEAAMIAAALWHTSQSSQSGHSALPILQQSPSARWRDEARREQISRAPERE